ncbi:MAG: hypothetical protein RIS97_1336 [Pseudomonadota bacterium]
MFKRLLTLIALIGMFAAAGAGALAWWVHQPLSLAFSTVEFTLDKSNTGKTVAQQVVEAGVQTQPNLLQLWFRLSGDARKIKAGSYELEAGVTPRSLLKKLVSGDQAFKTVTLVEGWTFSQVREALSKAEHLRQETRGLSVDLIMEKLGKPGLKAEGRFFPDTYTYAKGNSDLVVLKSALQAMNKKMAAAWEMRANDSPLKSMDDALTLASIVEKETGSKADRDMVGSVFNNRLRIGMPLQTDPTVTYGAGPAKGKEYDGNWLRAKADDNPWNTYMRTGLPPTPIAMPGKAALLAAVQPKPSSALYFVAKGDGTGASQFSDTLEEHNRAVNKYIRGK